MKVELWSITPDSERLIERAGRVCWGTILSATDDGTAAFIKELVRKGHFSVLEHAKATFFVSQISRTCSHQIVRHRIASYSQESQRYVDMSDPEWVLPPAIAENPQARTIWNGFAREVESAYRALRELGVRKEDSRFVLPNAAATRIIVTMNFRILLHLFRLRINLAAQWEIRDVCVRMLELVYPHAPSVFGDLRDELRTNHPAFFDDVDQ